MNEDFADTSFFIALVEAKDEFHTKAVELASHLKSDMVITSAVVLELGARFSPQRHRQKLFHILELLNHQGAEIVHVDESLQSRGMELFSARMDKDWSLTDCISFVVMHDRAITPAAASDLHFEQAGFIPLLRSDVPNS